MSEVKRWSIVPYDQYSVDERTSRNGEWVKWEDYEALAAERDRLAAENARLREAVALVRAEMNTQINGGAGWMARFEEIVKGDAND